MIRSALTEYGINVMDGKEGSTWEIAHAPTPVEVGEK